MIVAQYGIIDINWGIHYKLDSYLQSSKQESGIGKIQINHKLIILCANEQKNNEVNK